MAIKHAAYREIRRAIVCFTLLFDVTSNEFGFDFIGLAAQATGGEVLAQLGS